MRIGPISGLTWLLESMMAENGLFNANTTCRILTFGELNSWKVNWPEFVPENLELRRRIT